MRIRGSNSSEVGLIAISSRRPRFPEYPCAHCGLGAAVQTMLEGLVGSGPTEVSLKSGEVTRQYHSFRQYPEEEPLTRIYAGVLCGWSTYAGESVGRRDGAAELAAAAKLLPHEQELGWTKCSDGPLERTNDATHFHPSHP